jgi:aspartate aminotransferase
MLSLLEPLERFEAIRRRVARLGGRLCDLSYANPYEGAREQARAALSDTLAEERTLDLQYTPFGGQALARRAAADALRESHGLDFAGQDVVLTPGAMSALQLALRTAGPPGGEVVIPTPCWLDHPLFARAAGHLPRLVPLEEKSLDLDLEALDAALSSRTCAVVISQPSNPSGRTYTPGMLATLADVLRAAEKRTGAQITLISDEAHRDFVSEEGFTSPVTFYDRTTVVYSFGKYHFMQGQRLGYAAVSPRHPDRHQVSEEMVRWTRITGIATPTALMQRALPRLLTLRHDHRWLGPARGRLVEALRTHGYDVLVPDATMFVYARTPHTYRDDFHFVESLARRGVLALPAPVFHHTGHFRLSLTATEDMVTRALPIFEELSCA